MTCFDKPVLVVGAGPTGLTLAAALRWRGIPCRIIEQRRHRSDTSRAMGIQARTLDVLAKLSLADVVMRESAPLTGQVFHLSSGAVRSAFQGVHPRYPAMTILPQARTEQLLERVAPPVEWGCTFQGLEAGNVARVSDAQGRTERIEASWIVGCDGAHSHVRQAAGIPFTGIEYPARLLLADIELEGLDAGFFHVFTGQAMIAFKAPGGYWRLVVALPDTAPEPAHRSIVPFQRAGLHLGAMHWWSAFRIHQRRAAALRAGHVLLAGDAAHIHSPAGGQGMNVGIQDAWSLALALSQGEDAVVHWSETRSRVADRVLKASDRMTRAMLPSARWLAPVRDGFIRLAASSRRIAAHMEADIAGLRYPDIAG